MNLYGADILEYYIPLLEIYNIRQNSEFFDDSQIYVVVSGMLRNKEDNGSQVFSDGMLVTMPKGSDSKTLISLVDTKMVKVYRNAFTMPKIAKKVHILAKMEKERAAKLK